MRWTNSRSYFDSASTKLFTYGIDCGCGSSRIKIVKRTCRRITHLRRYCGTSVVRGPCYGKMIQRRISSQQSASFDRTRSELLSVPFLWGIYGCPQVSVSWIPQYFNSKAQRKLRNAAKSQARNFRWSKALMSPPCQTHLKWAEVRYDKWQQIWDIWELNFDNYPLRNGFFPEGTRVPAFVVFCRLFFVASEKYSSGLVRKLLKPLHATRVLVSKACSILMEGRQRRFQKRSVSWSLCCPW